MVLFTVSSVSRLAPSSDELPTGKKKEPMCKEVARQQAPTEIDVMVFLFFTVLHKRINESKPC